MLNELEVTDPERAAGIRKRREQRKQKLEDEEKEDQLFILPTKNIKSLRKKVVDNVGSKTAKQMRLEVAQKLLDRDTKYKQAKLKHKDQLAMEVALNTTVEIDKNVKRSVIQHTQAVIKDPSFHELIEKLVDEKTKDRLDIFEVSNCNESRILQLKEAFNKDDVKLLRREVESLREQLNEAQANANYERAFGSKFEILNQNPVEELNFVEPSPAYNGSPISWNCEDNEDGVVAIDEIEITSDSDSTPAPSGDARKSVATSSDAR